MFNIFLLQLLLITRIDYILVFPLILESRLVQHNQKSKGFTGNVNYWKVVYTEKHETKKIAHKRESQIKSWKVESKFNN